MMATLYNVSVPAINHHLKTIFTDKQLDENSVFKKYLITAADEKQYNTKHYNLQAQRRIHMSMQKGNLKNIVLFRTGSMKVILIDSQL
jgi:hypothetical protein